MKVEYRDRRINVYSNDSGEYGATVHTYDAVWAVGGCKTAYDAIHEAKRYIDTHLVKEANDAST